MPPPQRESPGRESEASQSDSAADLKLASSISQSRRTARFDSRRVRARRAIVRELDEFLGIFKYPDPAVIYAAAPSREAALDE
jgi:hypothetical protein